MLNNNNNNNNNNDLDENSLDEQAQVLAKQTNDLREGLYLEALKSVLSTRAGRRFIWGLMGKCGWGRTTYAGRNQASNFNSGRQSVANDLLVEIDLVSEAAFITMQQESREENNYVRDSISGGNTSSSDASSVSSSVDSINIINTSGTKPAS